MKVASKADEGDTTAAAWQGVLGTTIVDAVWGFTGRPPLLSWSRSVTRHGLIPRMAKRRPCLL